MMERCRLCLSDSENCYSLSEKREGLPISVLVMIICPIKIEPGDNLPRNICEECLEVVLSAYKLRDVSNKTDRYLRDDEVAENYVVKEEKNFGENFGSIYIEPLKIFEPAEEGIEESHHTDVSDIGLHVDCSKSKRSFAWQFFGKLCNASSEVVDDKFNYCSICVAKGLLRKYKLRVSLTSLLYHLKIVHNLEANDMANAEKVLQSKSIKKAAYLCDTCGSSFKDKGEIFLHMIQNHTKADQNNTDDCGLVLSSETELKHHMKEQHNTRSLENNFSEKTLSFSDMKFKIDCCRKKRTQKPSFVWDYFGKLKRLTGEEAEEGFGFIFCKLCAEDSNILHKFSVTSSTSVLIRHLDLKHSTSVDSHLDKSSTGGYSVNCYKESLSRSFVWKYMGVLIDSAGKPVKKEADYLFCKLCVQQGVLTKKFKRSCATTSYLKHLSKCHGITSPEDENPVEKQKVSPSQVCRKSCTICREVFESQKSLLEHHRTIHKTEETANFMCHVCSKTFSQSYVLKKHMRIHSDLKFSCKLCPATFSYIEGLKRHKSVHDPTHLTKYQCDRCTNAYAEMKSLKDHILTIHLKKSKARPHKCNECNMTFATLSNLKRHFMKHTGEVRCR